MKKGEARGGSGCAWFLLLIIVSIIVGMVNGAGTGWLVFLLIILFAAIS